MSQTEGLIEIYKCKYLVNAEYLKSVLREINIDAEIDYENNSILVNELDVSAAKNVIQGEKLDETETIDQENFMEGFEEWNKEKLNTGHYLGGNLPYYYRTKSNHMTFAILFFISSLLQIGIFFSQISLYGISFLSL